jgi:haloacetate dehalogenase
MVSDYRAGLRADREADDHDKGRQIGCPVLFSWSTRDDMVDLYGDPLAIWREWADDVRGKAIDSGHHMAEENPGALAAALRELLWRPESRR